MFFKNSFSFTGAAAYGTEAKNVALLVKLSNTTWHVRSQLEQSNTLITTEKKLNGPTSHGKPVRPGVSCIGPRNYLGNCLLSIDQRNEPCRSMTTSWIDLSESNRAYFKKSKNYRVIRSIRPCRNNTSSFGVCGCVLLLLRKKSIMVRRRSL